MGIGVIGRRRDPKPLLPERDGRIVDRLNVDVVVLEQEFTASPAQMGVADHQRQDMAWRIRHRHVRLSKHRLQPPDILPLENALRRMSLEMPHGRQCAGSEVRAKRRGENEAVGKAADHIHQQCRPGDIAAHDTERLRERSFDERDTIGDALLLGNASAARSVETDRMDFVEIGDGTVLLRDIADRGDRRHIAIHAVEAFERNDHGASRPDRSHLLVEMGRSLCRKMNRSAPERRIPSIIELWLSASEKIAQSGSGLPSVPSAARFEIHPDVKIQRGLLAMKVGKLGLKLDVLQVGSGDVSRSAGAGATTDGIVHRGRVHRDADPFRGNGCCTTR